MFEVLEPDKNYRYDTIGGKQRKTAYLYLLHSTTLKIHRTLNSSYLHICRYRFAPIPISQGMC